ncbi:MAG: magnesium transporter, partial [Asticcacaulis sp.]
MLILHSNGTRRAATNDDFGPNIVWLDLFNPTREEELRLESYLNVYLPTREDMAEIETSSRLYLEDGAAFMTAQVAFYGGESQLQSGPVTFVLTGGRLVTIRYIEPASFQIFGQHSEKQ